MRAYTPVGFGPFYVEFIIKVYFACPPKFPVGGKLTQFMHAMKVGDCLAFKGPLGELDFDANLAEAGAPRDAPIELSLSRFRCRREPVKSDRCEPNRATQKKTARERLPRPRPCGMQV